MIEAIVKRWKAEAPSAWNRVRRAALALSATAMAIWGANTSLQLNLDTYTLTICKYVILAGLIIATGAQLQTKKNEKI